jgi:hypothetical protein
MTTSTMQTVADPALIYGVAMILLCIGFAGGFAAFWRISKII